MLKRRFINTIAIVAFIALAILSYYTPITWRVFAVVFFIWLLITIFGSFFIRWNYHLTSLNANKGTQMRQVAITFDDGPNPEFTPLILDLLKKYDAKATFFCIGEHVEKHPLILKRIISEGHTVGNHTFSHSKNFGFFLVSKVVSELQKTNNLIKTLTGKQLKLYRPAFGVTNPMIEIAVNKLKVNSIGWNVRSLDTTSRSEKAILSRITSKVDKGSIILLHDSNPKCVAVLEQLLLFLKKKNLKSVTVDELLDIQAYA